MYKDIHDDVQLVFVGLLREDGFKSLDRFLNEVINKNCQFYMYIL